ncbi:diacylglycerol kinase [Photobacterium chitinilyticum]|uniref:Diacylglycerol kinase n=1 Tax=Photobacterium chitinilyticum TaxID=2485123 RepID=A0A3S3S3T4_9GAMM|nr:diacylglycerol kinase [Photobacterium chitinilyticum]RWX57533.1 diacylglycerol kinase [Photobacterium chitinilyticum]
MNNKQTGFVRLIYATKYSWLGLCAAWRCEAAFRQELVAFCVLLPAALLLPVSGLEKLILIGSVIAVIVVELLNSAIEAVVDRIGLEKHELSGQAKDMGSAAVLLTLIMAILTWVYIVYSNLVLS